MLADVLFLALVGLGVLNFFSPLIGIPRDPIITYALVMLGGVIFGFRATTEATAPRRSRRTDADSTQVGDSDQ
jgi:hypothetical protein